MTPRLLHLLFFSTLLGLCAASLKMGKLGRRQEEQPQHKQPISPPLSGSGKGEGPNTGEVVGYSLLGLFGVALVIGIFVGLRRRRRARARADEEYEMSRRRRRYYR
ncbi:uncharacterized protein B0T23DRAFT_431017 [Neurospora hispaniola]|uniref:Gram-positive cocci surface proteins LPxTG domain-containing protein n=1 Tax=Neurospora hispaniola TaxID=588809 RepID=A0AAJ0MQ45_9PEZI|nr:hypothetical protein B0T23DRAFT_431017 [Neurospora hispaniola]